ncbi:MAG: hypothetical protein V1807_02770 [Patescibacteria group bacterium]
MRIGPNDTHILSGWFRYNDQENILYSLVGTLEPAPLDDEEQSQEMPGPPYDEIVTERGAIDNDWEFFGELESPLLGVLEIAGSINYACGIMVFDVTDVIVPGVGLPPDDTVLNTLFELSAQNLTWAGRLTHPKNGPAGNVYGQAEILIIPINHLSHKLSVSKDVVGK